MSGRGAGGSQGAAMNAVDWAFIGTVPALVVLAWIAEQIEYAVPARNYVATPPAPPPMKSIQPSKGQHMKHIYAYTAPGACCPEYVSLNAHAQGGMAITVRTDSELRTSTAHLSDDQLLKLAQAITLHLHGVEAVPIEGREVCACTFNA